MRNLPAWRGGHAAHSWPTKFLLLLCVGWVRCSAAAAAQRAPTHTSTQPARPRARSLVADQVLPVHLHQVHHLLQVPPHLRSAAHAHKLVGQGARSPASGPPLRALLMQHARVHLPPSIQERPRAPGCPTPQHHHPSPSQPWPAPRPAAAAHATGSQPHLLVQLIMICRVHGVSVVLAALRVVGVLDVTVARPCARIMHVAGAACRRPCALHLASAHACMCTHSHGGDAVATPPGSTQHRVHRHTPPNEAAAPRHTQPHRSPMPAHLRQPGCSCACPPRSPCPRRPAHSLRTAAAPRDPRAQAPGRRCSRGGQP